MLIHKYILKNHLLPFLFGAFVTMSVFLLQFMMKFADRLVGKGLETFVIVKLIAYNLAWMIVLVVPMAVLVASLMAFGNMAQNNEVAVLKSSGMSLYRMMAAPFISSILIAGLLVMFNNHVYPEANHQARVLMRDISRKKPTFSLVPGVFSHEIPNYSILARKIDRETNTLKDLTIYDHSEPEKINIVTAQTGKIYFSENQKKLILDLKLGEIHETQRQNRSEYRILKFDKHKIALPAEQFTFQQSAPGGPRGDRELGAPEILVIIDSLNLQRQNYFDEYNTKLSQIFFDDSAAAAVVKNQTISEPYVNYNRVEDAIRAAENKMKSNYYRIESNKKRINKYWVEFHKKYSLPVACIVFVLVGAPLGTMVRKGGIGVAAGFSLLFYLIYWVFLLGGEKFADRGMFSPFLGVWSANFVLGALGIYLTIKAARERVELSFDFLKKIIPKRFRLEKPYDN